MSQPTRCRSSRIMARVLADGQQSISPQVAHSRDYKNFGERQPLRDFKNNMPRGVRGVPGWGSDDLAITMALTSRPQNPKQPKKSLALRLPRSQKSLSRGAWANCPVTILGQAPTHACAEFPRICSWNTSVYSGSSWRRLCSCRVDRYLKSAIQTHQAKDCTASASSV